MIFPFFPFSAAHVADLKEKKNPFLSAPPYIFLYSNTHRYTDNNFRPHTFFYRRTCWYYNKFVVKPPSIHTVLLTQCMSHQYAIKNEKEEKQKEKRFVSQLIDVEQRGSLFRWLYPSSTSNGASDTCMLWTPFWNTLSRETRGRPMSYSNHAV